MKPIRALSRTMLLVTICAAQAPWSTASPGPTIIDDDMESDAEAFVQDTAVSLATRLDSSGEKCAASTGLLGGIFGGSSADREHLISQCVREVWLRDGVGYNTEALRDALAEAADSGTPCAMSLFGLCQMYGYLGIPRDPSEGANLIFSALRQGEVVGGAWLAEKGVNSASTRTSSRGYFLAWLEAASKAGHGEATFRLARVFIYGPKELRDPARGIALLNLAIEQGSGTACRVLGFLYARGGVGVERDAEMALELYKLGAARDDVLAMYDASLSFAQGTGTPKDEEAALQMALRGAALGSLKCQVRAGRFIRDGEGTVADPALGIALIRDAALAEHAEALRQMAYLHKSGEFLPPDESVMADYYCRAAEGGNVSAMNSWALCLFDGAGVSADPTSAQDWMEQAARKGDLNAIDNLGRRFKRGRGVPADLRLARFYLEQAVELEPTPKRRFALGSFLHEATSEHAEAVALIEEAAAEGYEPAIRCIEEHERNERNGANARPTQDSRPQVEGTVGGE